MSRHGYAIGYHVHFPAGHAEMSAYITSDRLHTEFTLQQLCLDSLPGHQDIPQDVRTEDLVITRFHYTHVPPVSVPSGRVSLTKDSTRDTRGV